MVTAKQKSIIDIHIKKKKESIHNTKWETQEKKRTYKNKPITIKKTVIGTYILVITLNVNGLNAPTKRHRLAEWIQKQQDRKSVV